MDRREKDEWVEIDYIINEDLNSINPLNKDPVEEECLSGVSVS